MILLQWRRTKDNGGLELWVSEKSNITNCVYYLTLLENNLYKLSLVLLKFNSLVITNWINYKQTRLYIPESKIFSSQSGFHTAQAYLKLGATYLPIKPEDYKVPEE